MSEPTKTNWGGLIGGGIFCFGLLLLILMKTVINEYGVGCWLLNPEALLFLIGGTVFPPLGLYKIVKALRHGSSKRRVTE